MFRICHFYQLYVLAVSLFSHMTICRIILIIWTLFRNFTVDWRFKIPFRWISCYRLHRNAKALLLKVGQMGSLSRIRRILVICELHFMFSCLWVIWCEMGLYLSASIHLCNWHLIFDISNEYLGSACGLLCIHYYMIPGLVSISRGKHRDTWSVTLHPYVILSIFFGSQLWFFFLLHS